MKSQSIVRGSAIAFLVLVSLTTVGRASQESQVDASLRNAEAIQAIVGSWAETTSVGGGPVFSGLVTFGGGGVLVSSYQGSVITGAPLPASYTPSHGQWVHEGGRTYSTTSLQLVSDLAGNLLFVNTLRQRITLNKSKDRYRSVVSAEFHDPAGNLVFAFEGTTEGRRIPVEPLQ
jgi:hypothetical protein